MISWKSLLIGAAAGSILFFGEERHMRPASHGQGGVAKRTVADWQALWRWASELDTTPYVLGLLLFEESGMDPGIANSIGCVGLNQFCPGTYEYWVKDRTPDEYLQLSMADQLDYIGPFWQSKPKKAVLTTRDLFWINFLPATWVPNATRATIVNDPTKLGAKYALQVAQGNSVIAQGRPNITAGDIDDYLAGVAQASGWKLAQTLIAQNDPGSATANVASSDDSSDDADDPTGTMENQGNSPSASSGSDDSDPTAA